jgi:transglutaminase-like putative cysteine protease
MVREAHILRLNGTVDPLFNLGNNATSRRDRIVKNIQLGFDLTYDCADYTPMILMLNVHPSRTSDLLTPDTLRFTPPRAITPYVDGFGNKCVRVLAPPGEFRIMNDTIIADSGNPDRIDVAAEEHAVASLPHDTLMYLLGSRYCETDVLMDKAWALFGRATPGWRRVKAICDFVYQHINFNYQFADATRGAARAFNEQRGVCRDFTHLAVTLCRCLNIPARYCTGYLGDIGVPPDPAPMDFSAWFEAFVGGRWYTFDARHNEPRIGRVLIGRGRDAADVAISTTFGRNVLKSFSVVTYEMEGNVRIPKSEPLVA